VTNVVVWVLTPYLNPKVAYGLWRIGLDDFNDGACEYPWHFESPFKGFNIAQL